MAKVWQLTTPFVGEESRHRKKSPTPRPYKRSVRTEIWTYRLLHCPKKKKIAEVDFLFNTRGAEDQPRHLLVQLKRFLWSTLPGASNEGLPFAMLWHSWVAGVLWSREEMSTQKLSFLRADLVTQVREQVLQTLCEKAGCQFGTHALAASCSTPQVACRWCSPQRCCAQLNDLEDVSLILHSNSITSRWTKKLKWPISTASNLCIFLIMFYIFLYPLFNYGRIPFFLSARVLSQC